MQTTSKDGGNPDKPQGKKLDASKYDPETGLKRKKPRFIKAYSRLLRDPSISVNARLLFCVVKTYADRLGQSCFPSIERLMSDTGMSRKRINRAMRELIQRNLLSRKRQFNSSSTCLLHDEEWASLQQKINPAGLKRHGVKTTPTVGVKTTPLSRPKEDCASASLLQETPNVVPFELPHIPRPHVLGAVLYGARKRA